jgi:hypothetical protein
VVDEAGMVPTGVLARLADHAEATDSKLVLVATIARKLRPCHTIGAKNIFP